MKIYLVDFENVKSKGLQGIDNLTETDTVIIFTVKIPIPLTLKCTRKFLHQRLILNTSR